MPEIANGCALDPYAAGLLGFRFYHPCPPPVIEHGIVETIIWATGVALLGFIALTLTRAATEVSDGR